MLRRVASYASWEMSRVAMFWVIASSALMLVIARLKKNLQI
jgi:hypothetical protein